MREISSPLDGFLSPFGRLRGGAFEPLSVFGGGDDGFGFLNQTADYFTTTEAQTQTALGGTVAFMLDRASGAGYSAPEFTGLGLELDPGFSNYVISGTGTFTGSTEYTFEDTVGGQTRPGVQWDNPYFVEGTTYIVEIDVASISGASSIRIDSTGTDKLLTVGVTSFAFVANSIDASFALRFRLEKLSTSIGDGFTLNSVSARVLPGYHATQAGSSFLPLRRADGIEFDGLDDRLVTELLPSTSGTLIAKINGSAASRVAIGSQPASDGRCYLGLDASGRLAAGIGTQGTATIFGGSDIRNTTAVGAVTWDGSTVKLYSDGAEIYSAAQSGAVATTVKMLIGALNANGTAAAFWDGTVGESIAIDRALTPTEIINLTNAWS